MNCNLEELKALMPDAIRDVDYFNHIVIHQNDEIIRLLKKLTDEIKKIEESIEPIELVEPATASVMTLPIDEEKPKAKRKKKEV